MQRIKHFFVAVFHRVQQLSLLKRILIFATVILIVWFGGTKFLSTQTQKTQYQTTVAEKGTLISTITSSGTVSIGSSVSITTSATGVVNAIYIQNGDSVEQGQKIAEITLDQNSQQKQAAAWASYLGAQNSLNSAKSKMNGLQSALFRANQAFVTDKGVGSPSDAQKADPTYIQENADWLQAESDYNNQSGVISQAEASLSSAWLSYQQLSNIVTAPMSGTISNLTISEGYPLTISSDSSNATSTSSQSLGAVTINKGQLQANVNLSEIDVTKAKVGQKVTMTLDAFPDKTYTGRITAIDTNGSVSSGVTTYPTTITFDSASAGIYPNMAVNATIITKVKDSVLLVPSAAIQSQNGENFIRIMKNGQVQQVGVTVGDTSDTQTEITSGIQEGVQVVISTITSGTAGRTGSTTTSPFGGSGLGGFGGGRTIRVGGAGGR